MRGHADRFRRSRGQAAVETIALLPLIVFMFFLAVEAFTFIMTIEEVDSAARAGARVESQQGYGGEQAAYHALPSQLHNRHTKVRVYHDGANSYATVTARVPQLMGYLLKWDVTRKSTMPLG